MKQATQLSTWIAGILARDLRALRREVESFTDERDLWRLPPGISNSAGTLALHLAGNIRYYIGTVLGGTGYVRDRDAEFALRDVPRTDLLGDIDAAIVAVERGMARVRDADLIKPYPDPPKGHAVTTRDYLIHLIAHFTYHLGQVDYHRRLLTGQPGQIHAVSFGDLVTTTDDTRRA
jgi:uncharacterized damage-inducible protein DinB